MKHWFHVLPWMICYSLSLLKTELLIKIYLNGNCQVFGKSQIFMFLNSFTVSASKLMQLYIYITLSNLFIKNSFTKQRKCLWILSILLQETIKMDWILLEIALIHLQKLILYICSFTILFMNKNTTSCKRRWLASFQIKNEFSHILQNKTFVSVCFMVWIQ